VASSRGVSVRASLLSHPRLLRMAERLGLDLAFCDWAFPGYEFHGTAPRPEMLRMVVLAGLVRVWSAVRDLSPAGRLARSRPEDIDEMAGVPGFGRAMLEGGWLRQEEWGLQLPNFGEHDGPKKARQPESGNDEAFSSFWAAYPKKRGKRAARRAFDAVPGVRELLPLLLEAVARQAASFEWKKEAGRFVPHPATWLNNGLWEDEAYDAALPGAGERVRRADEAARARRAAEAGRLSAGEVKAYLARARGGATA
jgi:hypothetical protein